MATGEITTVTRTVETEVEAVVLTLDRDEAQALRDVLGWVGGDPKLTRRGLTDNVLAALREAGLSYRSSSVDFDQGTQGIYFVQTS